MAADDNRDVSSSEPDIEPDSPTEGHIGPSPTVASVSDQVIALLNVTDYDVATAEFFREAVDATMAQLDPTYGALRRLPMPEGVSAISVQVAGTDTASPEVEMSKTVSVERDDVTLGNLESFHEAVVAVAANHVETFMTAFYAHLDAAVTAVGNHVELSKETVTWDHLLDAFEKVAWMPNLQGQVQPPEMKAGKDAQKVIDELPKQTKEQRARFTRIALAKQEEYVSRRRSRRIRGELD